MRGGSPRLGPDVSGPLYLVDRFERSPHPPHSCREVYEGGPISRTSRSFFIPNSIESLYTERSTPS